MVSLAVVYHLCMNARNLRPSLKSFAALNDIEFILCDDNAQNDAREVAKSTEVDKLANFRYVRTSQEFGQAYAFNMGVKLASARYVYFADRQVSVDANLTAKLEEFIAKEGHSDLIVLGDDATRFFHTKQPVEIDSYRTFLNPQADLIFQTDWGLSNKIFAREFLLKYKIEMAESHYYPAAFILSALARFTKALYANVTLTTFRLSSQPDYNVYDYLFQILEFYEVLKKNNWTVDQHRAVEFWAIKAALYDFPGAILNTRKMSDPEREKALFNALKILDKTFPEWRRNPYLELIAEDKWRSYFKKFKSHLKWVRREFDTK